ncbi:hypothetical protein HPB49_023367 [Dermacentor silvarum]|uniref:Uncharacterized protein n=1 Tax=Dermacentor silvarum TaxID=543639 RepID=A0ACB8CNB5_DERSI|nr:hypothetical protein HPB49_023367 [Dermacentor silvarum]
MQPAFPVDQDKPVRNSRQLTKSSLEQPSTFPRCSTRKYGWLRLSDRAPPWCCVLLPLTPPQGSTSSACPSRCDPPGLALCSAYVAGATGTPQQPARDRYGACGAVAHTRRNRAVRVGSDACIVGDHIQLTRLTASYGRENGASPR